MFCEMRRKNRMATMTIMHFKRNNTIMNICNNTIMNICNNTKMNICNNTIMNMNIIILLKYNNAFQEK